MERNVARLFQDRAAAFGEVEFTQASILGGVRICSAGQPNGRSWDILATLTLVPHIVIGMK